MTCLHVPVRFIIRHFKIPAEPNGAGSSVFLQQHESTQAMLFFHLLTSAALLGSLSMFDAGDP